MNKWLRGFLTNQFSRLSRVTIQSEDNPDIVLQKRMLMACSVMIIPAGVLWGILYVSLKEYVSAFIPLGYSLVSLASILIYRYTRRFNVYRMTQLTLILVCPFLLMLSQGGFTHGSVVFIWAIMAPFGALLFYQPHLAPRWLVAYLVLLVISGIAQPFLPLTSHLPQSFITALFVLNIGTVSVISFTLLFHFVKEKNQALELLRLEQEKSERLLLNVLPKEIAPVLKEGQGVIAQYHESASVLFADVVGFTSLSIQLSPQEMVTLLNEVFSQFDLLVQKYGLEKIRTIGDNYMVASGVPVPRADHAWALANMALDLCEFIRSYPSYRGLAINFRVGMNSGPLIAGVIGRQKFHYDIWGDTVNTASRMESSGVPGKIQITESTHLLIQHQFFCMPRGKIAIKGKGEMETWFLEGRRLMAG